MILTTTSSWSIGTFLYWPLLRVLIIVEIARHIRIVCRGSAIAHILRSTIIGEKSSTIGQSGSNNLRLRNAHHSRKTASLIQSTPNEFPIVVEVLLCIFLIIGFLSNDWKWNFCSFLIIGFFKRDWKIFRILWIGWIFYLSKWYKI